MSLKKLEFFGWLDITPREALWEEVKSLEDQKKSLQEDNQSLRDHIEVVEFQNTNYEERIAKCNILFDKKDKTIRALENDKSNLQKQNATLNSELRAKKQRIMELEAEVEHLNAELRKVKPQRGKGGRFVKKQKNPR